jgi:hypothetical protein
MAGFLKIVKMYINTSLFDILYEVQKDLQDVSAGIGIFYPVHKNFVGNLTSKLARSTVDMPSTNRVKLRKIKA